MGVNKNRTKGRGKKKKKKKKREKRRKQAQNVYERQGDCTRRDPEMREDAGSWPKL